MSQKFTILFDLDGTLVDTAPDLVNAHNHVMEKFGYHSKSQNEVRSLIGKGAGTMLEKSVQNSKSIWGLAKKDFEKLEDPKQKKEMVKEFVDFYSKNICVNSKIVDGVKTFLEWCKSNNISMAVCTNKQEHLAIDLLKKIDLYKYLEYVAGCDTFDYCKPDSRHLTNVVEIIGGSIKKTILIGDSEVDSESAQNASIPFILLENGYTSKNISQIKHDHLVKNFIGLEKLIGKYTND
tara:strand:- start:37 stop:744 length:708 start_codon:yes stop_codon:yes gene_type:complete